MLRMNVYRQPNSRLRAAVRQAANVSELHESIYRPMKRQLLIPDLLQGYTTRNGKAGLGRSVVVSSRTMSRTDHQTSCHNVVN
jgi:hypothetical protein